MIGRKVSRLPINEESLKTPWLVLVVLSAIFGGTRNALKMQHSIIGIHQYSSIYSSFTRTAHFPNLSTDCSTGRTLHQAAVTPTNFFFGCFQPGSGDECTEAVQGQKTRDSEHRRQWMTSRTIPPSNLRPFLTSSLGKMWSMHLSTWVNLCTMVGPNYSLQYTMNLATVEPCLVS